MERLLASQLSQGALIAQDRPSKGPDASRIYVPAKDVAPQDKPRLRGIHAQHVTQRITDDSRGDNTDAQPPPWSRPAQSAWWTTVPAAQPLS